jgi:hypothetical protein
MYDQEVQRRWQYMALQVMGLQYGVVRGEGRSFRGEDGRLALTGPRWGKKVFQEKL